MNKKIALYLIIGISFIFNSNNTKAQEIKPFNNIGFYFSPVIQTLHEKEESNFNYVGSLFGMGTDIKIGDRSSIMINLDIGKLEYKFSIFDYNEPYNWEYPIMRYNTNRIANSIEYRYNITNKQQGLGLLYLSSGILINIHYKGNAINYLNNSVFIVHKLRVFNILPTLRAGYELDITKSVSLNLNFYLQYNIWQNLKYYDELINCSLVQKDVNCGVKIGIKHKF